jgi:hypothetical protein
MIKQGRTLIKIPNSLETSFSFLFFKETGATLAA